MLQGFLYIFPGFMNAYHLPYDLYIALDLGAEIKKFEKSQIVRLTYPAVQMGALPAESAEASALRHALLADLAIFVVVLILQHLTS